MADENIWIATGRVARHPEFIDDKHLVRFELVVLETNKGEKTRYKKLIKYFGESMFAILKANLRKDVRVLVSGPLKLDEVQGKVDIIRTEVCYARKVLFLSNKEECEAIRNGTTPETP